MLPAAHGDCLWIEWLDSNSDPDSPATRRLLIDGGPASTYHHLYERICSLPPNDRHFELLVITHIDADHIEGVLRLLLEPDLGVTFGDVWFNGWEQIKDLPGRPGGMLNIEHGQMLTDLLGGLVDRGVLTWNGHFGGEAVMTGAGVEPLALRGDAEVHVVGPTVERLITLRDEWEDAIDMHVDGTPAAYLPTLLDTAKYRPLSGDFPAIEELVPEPFVAVGDFVPEGDDDQGSGHLGFGPAPERGDSTPAAAESYSGQGKDPGSDTSVANGSSIAIVLTHRNSADRHTALLLAGDAFAVDLLSGVTALAQAGKLRVRGGRLVIDAFKLPHHGSVGNLTAELIGAIDCRDYLVSTNGATFHHPHRDALELIAASQKRAGKPRFHFNHRTDDGETAVANLAAAAECHWPLGATLEV